MGLSLARECLQRGCRVTVLERHAVARHGVDRHAGGAASPAALGVLNVPKWGVSPWRGLLALAYAFYPGLARELRKEGGVDIGLRRRGALHLLEGLPAESDREKAECVYGNGGFDVRWLDRSALAKRVPWSTSRFGAALWLPGEHIVSPPALLAGLRTVLAARGAVLRDGVGAARLHASRRAITLAGGETIEADFVFIATGSWLASVLPPDAWGISPVDPVCGQAIELRSRLPEGPTVHFSSAHDGCAYYFLAHGSGRAWVGSTVEQVGHRCGTTPSAERQLLTAAAEVDTRVRARDVLRHWTGLRPKAMRLGGPFLDRLPGRDGVWIATGHYRSGILAGPVSASLLVRQVFEPDTLVPRERQVLEGFAVANPS